MAALRIVVLLTMLVIWTPSSASRRLQASANSRGYSASANSRGYLRLGESSATKVDEDQQVSDGDDDADDGDDLEDNDFSIEKAANEATKKMKKKADEFKDSAEKSMNDVKKTWKKQFPKGTEPQEEQDDDDQDDADDDDDEETEGEENKPEDAEDKAEKKRLEEKRKALEEAAAQAERDLETNQKKQLKLETQIAEIEDTGKFRSQLAETEKLVANETQSPHLAGLLTDMWQEMRTFASPFYKEHLEQQILHLKTKERKLEKKLNEATAKEQEVVAKPAAKKHKAAEAKPAGPQPMYTEETMPDIAPAFDCVVILSWQFFLIWTALSVLRSLNHFTDGRFMNAQKLLEVMNSSVTFAPMLCVLFLATRMRAIHLTQGEPRKYELPQPWVQAAIYTCTFAVLGQLLWVLLVAFTSHEIPQASSGDDDELRLASNHGSEVAEGLDEEEDVLHGHWSKDAPRMASILTVAHYVILLALYGGAAAVCYGALAMKAPQGVWKRTPLPDAALVCTLGLSVLFFAAYLGVSITTVLKHTKDFPDKKVLRAEHLFAMAKHSVDLAPMLGILFLAARARAMQLDPKYATFPEWASICFYVCAVALAVKTIATVVLPLFDPLSRIERGAFKGEISFFFENKALKVVGMVIKWVCMACIYAGACAIIWAIYTLGAPLKLSVTVPGISSSLQCIILLTSLFVISYTLVFVVHSITEFIPHKDSPTVAWLTHIVEAGIKATSMAPMLCVLFFAAQMHAVELTKTVDGKTPPEAGPQGWVQEGMYLSTWALFIQLLCTYVTVAVAGPGHSLMDWHHEKLEGTLRHKVWLIIISIVKYLSMAAMYGGVITVMVGMYFMTPETLSPYADYQGIVPGYQVPQPTVPPSWDSQKWDKFDSPL